MTPQHRRAGRSKSHERSGADREWIGGRLTPPWFIEDRAEPYRPVCAIWIETPSEFVVGQKLVAPEDSEGVVAAALLAAIEEPMAGPPRRPDRIRVADDSLAAEVRAAVDDEIPVVIAPTPELDVLLEAMIQAMPGNDADSYLAGGRIAPALIAELFSAAQVLYRIAPWKVADDTRVLRMDIPALGVEGACVSIIGQLGESLGFLVFPSIEGFEAFEQAAEKLRHKSKRFDLGTGWLSLNFERGADLPASLRREVATHAWPVADADAYPHVERRERDGASRPLVERDVKIASACAASLSAFFIKHRALFEADSFEPVCESYFDNDDLEVRFTAPYEAFSQFDVGTGPGRQRQVPLRSERRSSVQRASTTGTDRAAPQPVRVGRNDLCPCGSGLKYKKCHLALDEQEASSRPAHDPSHDLDNELTLELVDFAESRFGDEWMRHTKDFFSPTETMQLAVPWSVYGHRLLGKTALEWFLEEHGRELSRSERRWLAAQQAAWLSVWEVTGVERGVSLSLRDLLSDQTRCVREISGSQSLVVRDNVLARVVDHDGVSLLCGIHPRPLPPLDAANVVRRARARLRRKRAVPVERLRDEALGRYLIRRWEEAVDEFDFRSTIPPSLSNTDGDPLLLTTDHFVVAPGARASIDAALRTLEGVEPPDAGGDSNVYVFLRRGNPKHPGWENTVIGHARITGTVLRLETNSQARADALRERVEAACGEQIRHRAREHADPMSSQAPPVVRDPAQEAVAPELEQLALELKQRHLVEWLDMTVPALGGKTPREAARTAQGRAEVGALLKDFENREHRSGSGAALDFSKVRKELRLE